MKVIAKRCVQAIFLCLALPAALLAGFGRAKFGFEFFAQTFALVRGVVQARSRVGMLGHS
jgi:hypothetical protein